MDNRTLVLIGHGAEEDAQALYLQFAEEVKESWPDTWLVMLHREPSAETVIAALQEKGVRRVLLLPLLLAPGSHLHKDVIAPEGKIRTAFSASGIETEVVGQALLSSERVRQALKEHCLSCLCE